MTGPDPKQRIDLARFVSAQEKSYSQALAEIRSGRKESHWMWFVFPQLRGLGRSAMAERYGLAGLAEARAYLGHPVLGPRLAEMSRAMRDRPGSDADAVLGAVDAMKLRSCATLFEAAGGDEVFAALLDTFFGGARCPITLRLLRQD